MRSKIADEDLKLMFDSLRAEYGGDFVLMFLAMHLEIEERCAQLELRIGQLEARKK